MIADRKLSSSTSPLSNGSHRSSLSFSRCCRLDFLFGFGIAIPFLLWGVLALNTVQISTRKMDFFVGKTMNESIVMCTVGSVLGLAFAWWRYSRIVSVFNHGIRIEAQILVIRENCITLRYVVDESEYKKSLTPSNHKDFVGLRTTEIIVDPARPKRCFLA